MKDMTDLNQSMIQEQEYYSEEETSSEDYVDEPIEVPMGQPKRRRVVVEIVDGELDEEEPAKGKKTKAKRKPSSKPPSEKQLLARRNFKILARARLNYMNETKDENGKRHKPEKGWKPTPEMMQEAEKQLIAEGKLE